MFLSNKLRQKRKGRVAGKRRLLLATAALIATSGITQAKITEFDTKDDIFGGRSGSMSAKLGIFPMDEPKSAINLLELPSSETLKNLPATVIGYVKEADPVKILAEPSQATGNFKGAAQLLEKFDRLLTANILDFTKLAYSANQQEEWGDEEKEIYCRLAVEEGWEICPFNGTTGTATNQVESISGFVAFKENHVVIATRGTEMTNWNDWMTNFRFSRSPFLRMFSGEERNKISAATAQLFGLEGGEIANGFLQTHLSSWGFIRDAILKRSEFLGVPPSELKITVTGHSLGGAKAQLVGVNLATERALDIGVHKIEGSFFGEDDFYSPAIYSKPENPENIEVVVFGSPNVFTEEAAEQVEEILGEDIYRVENNGSKHFRGFALVDVIGDIVPSLPPRILGFKPVGKRIEDKGQQGIYVGRHVMSNISKAALDEVDAARLTRLLARREAVSMPSNTAAPAA